MKILLQFPEGLKQYAHKYAKELEAKGNEVYVSASPSFGACDLALDEAKKLGAQKLVHFGHAEFMHVNSDIEIEYVPYSVDADLSVLEKSVPELVNHKKIGLVTTIQHIHQLDDVKRFLEENGKEVFIGRPYGFAKKPGQVLGCDVGSAATINNVVEAFVYFGGGLFHPTGALYATDKPFLVVDPYVGKCAWIDSYRDAYKKAEKAKLMRSMQAKKFGILVTKKVGQHNLNLGKVLKKLIENAGFEATILIGDTFDFDALNNMMEFDAFVNTACPRLTTEDNDRLRKPLLSANNLTTLLQIVKAKA